MSLIDPTTTTAADVANAALVESGAIAQGQTAGSADFADAVSRLGMMLQQWQRQRFLVYSLQQVELQSQGKVSYSVGAGGDFDTGAPRPDGVATVWARQFNSGIPVDYYMEMLPSFEDYSRVSLKSLQSFPSWAYYNPTFPLGTVYFYPVPQAGIYTLFLLVKTVLPQVMAADGSNQILLPYEYYYTMVYNLAIRLRSKYRIPSFPGDPLPVLAKDSLEVLRKVNAQIPELRMPAALARPSFYNIFGDTSY